MKLTSTKSVLTVFYNLFKMLFHFKQHFIQHEQQIHSTMVGILEKKEQKRKSDLFHFIIVTCLRDCSMKTFSYFPFRICSTKLVCSKSPPSLFVSFTSSNAIFQSFTVSHFSLCTSNTPLLTS